MALPERLFYTLEQAAENAKCSVDDLLHYAYMGVLQLCFLVPDEIINDYYDDTDDDDEYITISSNFTSRLNGKLLRNIENTFVSYETMYTRINETSLKTKNGIEVKTDIKGLLALDFGSTRELYYQWNKNIPKVIGIDRASPPRVDKVISQTEGYEFLEFDFSPYWYMEVSNIYISHYELQLLKGGGEYYWYNENEKTEYKHRKQQLSIDKLSPKSFNAQVNFIKDLLFIKYGEEAIDNPRNFVEKNRSPLVKDFELQGLKYPSGKSLEKWLKK